MAGIRIKDIALLAGVSTGTVDRVIHQRAGVSAATRERIQKLLDEHHYMPDLAGRSLALKKTFHLAVLMPRPTLKHSFWKLPGKGLAKALDERLQYNIQLEEWYFDQFDRTSFEETVLNFPFDRLDGVLFAPVFLDESKAFLKSCEEQGLPVVLFNSLIPSPAVQSFVGQDAYQSGQVAGRLIHYGLDRGKDLAIINMSLRKDHYAHIIEREKGFRSYFSAQDRNWGNIWTLDLNGADKKQLKSGLESLFSERDPGGVFVTNSRVYEVAAFLSTREHLRPRLVGYDLLPDNIEYLTRGQIDFLISQKPEEQARVGLGALFDLLALQRQPASRIWLPIDIISRENLRYYDFN